MSQLDEQFDLDIRLALWDARSPRLPRKCATPAGGSAFRRRELWRDLSVQHLETVISNLKTAGIRSPTPEHGKTSRGLRRRGRDWYLRLSR